MSKLPALTHYSHEHLHAVDPGYAQSPDASYKPKGFWVSVDEGGHGWADFCRADEWNLAGLEFVHDVRLRPDANVLVIDGYDAFDEFDAGFGAPMFPGLSYSSRGVLWHRVAALYSGIIIAPYLWGRRLADNAAWYYGWDCASGCIWDVSVIESITLRVPAEAAA